MEGKSRILLIENINAVGLPERRSIMDINAMVIKSNYTEIVTPVSLRGRSLRLRRERSYRAGRGHCAELTSAIKHFTARRLHFLRH